MRSCLTVLMKHVKEHNLLLKDVRHFVLWPTVEASAKYGVEKVLFLLALSRAPYNVPAHAGSLCDKTAVLGAAIKNPAGIGYVPIWKSVIPIMFL
jgi:hypothetical protein